MKWRRAVKSDRHSNRHNAAPFNTILKLMNGATWSDWSSLLDLTRLTSMCSLYDYDSKSLLSLDDSIPWYVKWFAARFNPKHIHRHSHAPEVPLEILSDSMHRVYWRWKLGQHTRDDEPLFVRLRKLKPARCNLSEIPNEIKAWWCMLRQTIMDAYRKARQPSIRCAFPGLPIVKLARKWLKDHSIRLIPGDKEGGNVLISQDAWDRVHSDITSSRQYRLIDSISGRLLLREYMKLCDTVAPFHGKQQAAHLKRTALQEGTWVSRLKLLCKTHKPPGAVSFRNIHASPAPCARGLSTWVGYILRKALHEVHGKF